MRHYITAEQSKRIKAISEKVKDKGGWHLADIAFYTSMHHRTLNKFFSEEDEVISTSTLIRYIEFLGEHSAGGRDYIGEFMEALLVGSPSVRPFYYITEGEIEEHMKELELHPCTPLTPLGKVVKTMACLLVFMLALLAFTPLLLLIF